MNDDRKAIAREQAKTIEEAIVSAKLEMVWAAQDMVKGGGTNIADLDKLRRYIEALEYALACVPSAPARAKMLY